MKHLKGLDHPDSKTAEELAAFAPEDKETMERIFSRAEEKYRAKQETPAETEHFEVTEYKPRRILTAVVSLAACAVIAVSGWSIWQLSQHKPPVSPTESVSEHQSSIPFYDIIAGQELSFLDSSRNRKMTAEQLNTVTISSEQRAEFESILERLNWEVTGEYNAMRTADLLDSKVGPGSKSVSFSFWTDAHPDTTFALWRTESLFIWFKEDGTSVTYRLSLEDFDALYAIVFARYRIPCWDAIESRELQFDVNGKTDGFLVLNDAQREQVIQILAGLNWTEIDEEDGPRPNPKLTMMVNFGPDENDPLGDLLVGTLEFYPELERVIWFERTDNGRGDVLKARHFALTQEQFDALYAIVTPQNQIPFQTLIEHQTVYARTFMPQTDRELGDAEKEALLKFLSTISWEPLEVTTGSNAVQTNDEDVIFLDFKAAELGTPRGTVEFIKDAGIVQWLRSDGDFVTGVEKYALTTEQYDALHDLVFGSTAAKPDVPFRAAAEDALANGRDLQFYGNPDEEGYPVLSLEQIDGFLEMMQQVNWQEDENAADMSGNAIRLFIPADDPMKSQTVYFYKNCITWSESPASSFLHVYPFTAGQYTALHDLVFGSCFNADLPFRTDDFRSDICVGVTPAYAPNLIHVLPNLQEEIADAMDQSEWEPLDDLTVWDGERTILYALGGDSGAHYSLTAAGDTVIWSDGTQEQAFRVSEEVTLAFKKAMSPPAMAAQNGMDPSQYLIPCESLSGDMNEVWDAVDAYFEENADLSEYQEVVDRFNAEHRTDYQLWTREMCRQNGMSYVWYLMEFLAKMTPEEFGQYLADTNADSSMPDLPPSIPNFDAGEEVTVTISNDNHPRELNDEQKAKLLDFINTYEWIPLRIEGEPEDTPENMFTVSNADGSKYLRFYRSDGLALWKATSNGVTATTYLTLPTDEISRILNE